VGARKNQSSQSTQPVKCHLSSVLQDISLLPDY
jgi:hypothetical protein